MDAGQYQIPESEQVPAAEVAEVPAPETALIQDLESAFDPRDVQKMNELKPYNPYFVEEETAQKLETYRAQATPANLPKSTALDFAQAALERFRRYV